MSIVKEQVRTGERRTLARDLPQHGYKQRNAIRELVIRLRTEHERDGWVVYAE